MFHSNIELIKHINDECEFILNHTKGVDFDSFLANKVLTKAIERCLEIIGEASTKIDNEFKTKYPEIEWRKISVTRNIIIHHYSGIDYDIVWEIIKNDIPELEFQIKNIIKENEQKNS
jgi:uncharacterized protein with HEPN domain